MFSIFFYIKVYSDVWLQCVLFEMLSYTLFSAKIFAESAYVD